MVILLLELQCLHDLSAKRCVTSKVLSPFIDNIDQGIGLLGRQVFDTTLARDPSNIQNSCPTLQDDEET